MVLSPDGTQFAAFSEEERVKVIDLASGRESRSFKIPADRLESLQLSFTPDGRLIAAGIVDNHFRFWDLTSKKDQELARITKDFTQVKFSRDARFLALSEGYAVRVWELASMRELPSLTAPNSGLWAQGVAYISFSEDGKRLATGGFDTDTLIWETETGKQLTNLTGRTNLASNVAFSADGTQLYSGDRTRWDLRTGRGLRLAPRPSEKSFGTPSPDAKLMAVTRPNSG